MYPQPSSSHTQETYPLRALLPEPPCDDDTILMLRAAAGDAGSFNLLVERHRGPLVKFLYRKTRDYAAAEELAQDTFVRAYLARARYQPQARYRTWLYCIAVNLAANWSRKNRLRMRHMSLSEHTTAPAGRSVPHLPDPARRPDEQLTLTEMRRQVRVSLGRLPRRQQVAVHLHKFDELTYEQIACEMGGSLQMVRSLLFRAYTALRVDLGAPSGTVAASPTAARC